MPRTPTGKHWHYVTINPEDGKRCQCKPVHLTLMDGVTCAHKLTRKLAAKYPDKKDKDKPVAKATPVWSEPWEIPDAERPDPGREGAVE